MVETVKTRLAQPKNTLRPTLWYGASRGKVRAREGHFARVVVQDALKVAPDRDEVMKLGISDCRLILGARTAKPARGRPGGREAHQFGVL